MSGFSLKQLVPNYEVQIKGKLGNTSLVSDGRSYNEDVYKSLDEVVEQRGISRPPHYKGGSSRAGDDDLPITGRNARILQDSSTGNERGAREEVVRILRDPRSNETRTKDPRETALDDLFEYDSGEHIGRRFHRGQRSRSSNGRTPTFSVAKMEATMDSSGAGTSSSFSRASGGGETSSTATIKLHKHLDPKTCSLDELIVGGNEDEEGQGKRFNKRRAEDRNGAGSSMDVDSGAGQESKRPRFDSSVLTPYRAVGYLSQKGMVIQMKIGKLEEDNPDVSHLWRCEIQCGALSGKAESERKTVAREIACLEFLRILKEEFPDGKIPDHRIPEELFLDPKIFKKMADLSSTLDLGFTHFIKVIEDPNRGRRRPVYKCTYMVDGVEVHAEHQEMEYAKIVAAGKAYTFLTDKIFPKTEFFVGNDCKDDYEYIYTESEVYHIFGEEERKTEAENNITAGINKDGGALEVDEDEELDL